MVKEINLSSSVIIDSGFSSQDIINLVLKNRGISDIADFLNPKLPDIKLDLNPSINLIRQAIKNNQNILIYGDYDVDGITATATLWQAIHKIYPKVTPFVPHREIDGYGLKAKSFFRFQAEKNIKFDLLITVDNGIVAGQELQKIIDKQDIKIIITDHHLPNDEIELVTRNCELIHSTEISGSAISYFLAKEIDNDTNLGLASLGTVADCLPLVGINRSIVVHGLKDLQNNPSPGINSLIKSTNINPKTISTYDLGFILGPRINAVGRLSDPTDALRLLCSSSESQALKYTQVLNNFNQDRQLIQKESLDIADKNINLTNKIIILDGDYNPGIIGLISGRLTEKYYLPSIIISVDGQIGKGSCRSIPELNIINTLREYSDLFIDLGGHSGAAGFSIYTKNISKLKKAIIKSVNLKLNKLNLVPHLDVDAQMDVSAVTKKNILSLETLSPFGIGNREPLFLFKGLVVDSIRTIGQNNEHLKLTVRIDSHICPTLSAIAFKKGGYINQIKTGDKINFVASLSINEWNNVQSPQLIIKEILL